MAAFGKRRQGLVRQGWVGNGPGAWVPSVRIRPLAPAPRDKVVAHEFARFGRGSVVPARVGLAAKRTWSAKFEIRIPRHTTQAAELPTARA
nr:DUF4113 domain-containing protein [Methylobacterium sp. Leaf108]